MSIASEITRISNAKLSIVSAIAEKGVTVPSGTLIDGMPTLIGQIQTGGGLENVVIKEVTFTPTTSGAVKVYSGVSGAVAIGFVAFATSAFDMASQTLDRMIISYNAISIDPFNAEGKRDYFMGGLGTVTNHNRPTGSGAYSESTLGSDTDANGSTTWYSNTKFRKYTSYTGPDYVSLWMSGQDTFYGYCIGHEYCGLFLYRKDEVAD